MKLLFVTSRAHISGVGGGATYSRAMLTLLRRLDSAEVESLEIDLPWSGLPLSLRQSRAFLHAALSDLPAKSHYAFRTGASRELTKRQAPGDIDAVVFNGSDLLPLARHIYPGIRKILVSHNVESAIIAEQVSKARVPGFLRAWLRKDAERTRECEIAGAKAMDLIVTISVQDAEWYRKHAPGVTVIVIPAAFSQPPYSGPRPGPGLPLQLAMLAKMSWWPNRQGAQWMVGEVLPQLPEERCWVHFFGPGSEEFDRTAPRLKGHGFAESLDKVWSMAHCPPSAPMAQI